MVRGEEWEQKERRRKRNSRGLGVKWGTYPNIRLPAKGTGFGETVEEQVGEACVDLFAIAKDVLALAHNAKGGGGCLKWV